MTTDPPEAVRDIFGRPWRGPCRCGEPSCPRHRSNTSRQGLGGLGPQPPAGAGAGRPLWNAAWAARGEETQAARVPRSVRARRRAREPERASSSHGRRVGDYDVCKQGLHRIPQPTPRRPG